MGEQESWKSISGPGIPPGAEVNVDSGNFRVSGSESDDEEPGDDGPPEGDPEPRNPIVPSAAGAAALELAQQTEE